MSTTTNLDYQKALQVASTPINYRILALLALGENAITVQDICERFPNIPRDSIETGLYKLRHAHIIEASKKIGRQGFAQYHVADNEFAQTLFASGLLRIPRESEVVV